MADLRDRWNEMVATALGVSQFAVELSALSESELDGLTAFLDSAPPLPFTYVSVHGPTKSLTLDDDAIGDLLCRLPPTVDVVVMHPDTIRRPEAYGRLG